MREDRIIDGHVPDVETIWRRLRAIHDESWDPTVAMVRLAPGTTPGKDLSAFDLHVVRESALGAYLDLADGRRTRALETLTAVLQHQYDAPGTAWHGTFRVTAEQADPPAVGAREWYHYDPNWRQFLGVVLALCVEDHEDVLGRDLVAAVIESVRLAADSEPVGRIPDWYTNPNLLQAWLQAWVGVRVGVDHLTEAGVARVTMLVDRLDRFGDVDEYNSPTYDGIDLLAAGIWSQFPPSPEFGPHGDRFLAAIGGRLGALYSRELGIVCGPHIRAYGLDMRRYVSLVGLWLALAGEPPERMLPHPLTETTVHIHDLYFLPLFARLSHAVLPRLEWARSLPRRHEQRFADTTATSVIGSGVALGAEHGRVPDFARDQYVGLTIHALGADGDVHCVGFKIGEATDTFDAHVDGERAASAVARASGGMVELVVLSSQPLEHAGRSLTTPTFRITFDRPPSCAETENSPSGVVTTLEFDAAQVTLNVRVVA